MNLEITKLPSTVNFSKLHDELKTILPSIELSYSEDEQGQPSKLIIHSKGYESNKLAALQSKIDAHIGTPDAVIDLETRLLTIEARLDALENG